MADEKQKGLDGLFSEYEERKQKESKEKKLKQSEENALRDKTIECITNTIIPILLKRKEEIEAKGHHVVITQNLENPYPTVEFSFTPKDEQSSKILFKHSGKGTIEIEKAINYRQVSPYNVEEKHEKVTEQWVEITLFNFIKEVLNPSNPEDDINF